MNKNDIIDKVELYIKQQSDFGKVVYIEQSNIPIILSEKKLEHEEIHNNKLVSKNELKSFPTDSIVDLFTEEPEWKKVSSVKELYDKIHNCQNCSLGKTRKNFVFGTGNPNAGIMVIGEAPGADEDAQGEPFVGRAGQLLTKILESINLKREEVFICNILKCRPPENRNPLPVEVDECEPYLKKQIELIKPAFILALGLTAVDTLLKKKHKMGDIRGSVLNYHSIKMLVTYHPAALLRNPEWKKPVWEDMKLLRRMYDDYLNK
ncbi:MAG: uracil-DNA glycosylase [FCB group bacterium]|jgi:DNA polymerase